MRDGSGEMRERGRERGEGRNESEAISLLSLLKGVLIEPTATFRDIDRTATPGRAAVVVIVAGSLPYLLHLLGMRDLRPGGVVMWIMFAVGTSFLMWFVLSVLCHQAAVHLFRGQATFRTTLTALGFAHTVHLIALPIQMMLSRTPLARGPILIAFFAWHILLLVIALRETHDITNGRSIVSLVMGGILPVFLSGVFAVGRSYVAPHLPEMPWREPGKDTIWQDPPTRTENLIANPGFEELDPESDPDTPAHWKRRTISMPFGKTRMIRDETAAWAGNASALVVRTGAPVAIENGWTQKVEGVQPEDVLYIEVWMRTEEAVAAAATVRFIKKEEKQSRIVGMFNTSPVTGTEKWKPCRIRVAVPEEATEMILGVYLWGAGKLWIDDVSVLREVSERAQTEDASGEGPTTDKKPVKSAGRE